MKQLLFVLFVFFCRSFSVFAQEGSEVFSFLHYPASTRINALGGQSVSLIERDPSLALHNPGLLGAEMDGMINLNYMNFISDINLGSVVFSKAKGERGAWGVGASFISYGNFKQRSTENVDEGSFSAKDINITALYAHDLSDKWRGGIAFKFLYSSFERYSAIGLCADVGLSYYNDEKGLSFGLALKNMGAQLKSYEDERGNLPWDIQLGVSKKMEYNPIRFSATAIYLNKWKINDIDLVNIENKESFFKTFFKHFIFGIDYIPSDNFWIGIGFNPKANQDMSLQTGNKLGGFSIGAGINIQKIDITVSVARYHPSATSLMLGVSTTFSDFK
ncbi:MAG: type IX secretion system protein PorQ [Massilibacteroides sp.]|nr:type IX secretion system protein PorQ [Massilibacteroides sp.]MDD3062674.1 type IX secretion system protein PorQ [Massilibacteroides sp.]MDD4114730.1 type IX secretion system protein PorQ [Massilibacteroides sp.]MDD4660167.1 type IX secretion system protein PorQ [Massilibacteroides sp.]